MTTSKAMQTEPPTSGLRFGRIPITNVQPVVSCGAFSAKAVPGQNVAVSATVFREGHDRLGVTAVLFDPRGKEVSRTRLVEHVGGTDSYSGWLTPASTGNWSFAIEGWGDLYATWQYNAEVKIEAGVDVELMLAEGAVLLEQAAGERKRPKADRDLFRSASAALRDKNPAVEDRLGAGTSAAVRSAVERLPIRNLVTSSERYPLLVEREAAGRGSWYEFFPRSIGAEQDPATLEWTSGNFTTAA
ncbi:maltotransferase domain-containing protein, partial [Arthrobacter sp. H14]|uniref:maltotransferase domain-containing protein n=1 Tax=Arthrobacter sp. H14 TaxID=1312959 RepID=UPI0020A6B1F6